MSAEQFISISCVYCSEQMDVTFSPIDGDSDFIVDCENCCRPMRVTIRTCSGEVDLVHVSGE